MFRSLFGNRSYLQAELLKVYGEVDISAPYYQITAREVFTNDGPTAVVNVK